MAVYSFRIGPYARSIYVYGASNFGVTLLESHQPVKQHASVISQQSDCQRIYHPKKAVTLIGNNPFELPLSASKEVD